MEGAEVRPAACMVAVLCLKCGLAAHSSRLPLACWHACAVKTSTLCPPPMPAQVGALRLKMSRLLGRSMRMDDASALFYINEAGGDVKAAMGLAAADAAWEDTTPGPIRTVPVQRWIRGEAGL